jgi:hypothetical protein
MTVRAPFCWLAIVGLAAALALASISVAGAASDVQVTVIDCVGHPRRIAIQNLGDTTQSLAAWKLLSDQPNEVFDLSVVGQVAPGDTFYIFNGHKAPPAPEQIGGQWIYPWNYTPVLDESAFVLHEDGKDFIRLVDASGFPWREVSAMPCRGTTDIPPLQQPATPTPSPSSSEPGSQNPSQTDEPSSGQTVSDQSGGAGQSVSGGNTGQGSNTQTTAQAGNVSGQVAGGPASGVGALATGSGGPFLAAPLPLAFLILVASAALGVIGGLILRRAIRHP